MVRMIREGHTISETVGELVAILEKIRTHFGAPVIINSGCRCPAHNRKSGGVTGSQHLFGTAADIHISGVTSQAVADFAETILPGGGIGIYKTFTHIDVRQTRARWQG